MILGIDPGVSTTGLAIIEHKSVVYHKTLPGEKALELIPNLHTVYKFEKVVIEEPKAGIFYARHVSRGGIHSFPGMIKVAQNVGENIAMMKRIMALVENMGLNVLTRHPMRKQSKWDKHYWAKIFSWPEGKRLPSEHARDAAVLALLNENNIKFINRRVGFEK